VAGVLAHVVNNTVAVLDARARARLRQAVDRAPRPARWLPCSATRVDPSPCRPRAGAAPGSVVRVKRWSLQELLPGDARSGVVLITCAAVAMGIANSALGPGYFRLLGATLVFGPSRCRSCTGSTTS
jgi:hypothetical protein